MKIKNISSRVISIGEILLLPDSDATVNKNIASLPSVKALESKGFLVIFDDGSDKTESKPDTVKPEVKAEETVSETKVEETVAEDTPKETKPEVKADEKVEEKAETKAEAKTDSEPKKVAGKKTTKK